VFLGPYRWKRYLCNHPERGVPVTFQVGDKVIYPNHGLGVVERIETKTILGTVCDFYQLRMVANETTVLVPVNNVDSVGLRRAVCDEEIQRLYGLLSDGNIDSHQNWKGRFKDNSDRMRTGSIYDVVEVLKSLCYLSKTKNLSFREKRMLDRARFLVISEISEVTHQTMTGVEVMVDEALCKCFKTKDESAPARRPAAAAIAASVAAPKVATATRASARRALGAN
jgi:CarD family transcriptional regulator